MMVALIQGIAAIAIAGGFGWLSYQRGYAAGRKKPDATSQSYRDGYEQGQADTWVEAYAKGHSEGIDETNRRRDGEQLRLIEKARTAAYQEGRKAALAEMSVPEEAEQHYTTTIVVQPIKSA